MIKKQVSVFLENRPGRLLFVFDVLADAGLNVIAHNIVDASDFGIVHLLVDDPERAIQAVRDAGLTCSMTEVIAVTVPDEPGAFVKRILRPLAAAEINVEYSYAYSAGSSDEAHSVLKVDDLEKAGETLAQLD